MTNWQVLHKPSYDTDFIELDKGLQRTAINGIRDLEQDPVTPRGNTIKPLKGYKNVYRYRMGDHRLIYAVAPDVNLVQLLAVGHRRHIYERFNFPGWEAPEAAVEFGPELADKPEWMNNPEWFRPEPKEEEKERLPRTITPSLLNKWLIEDQYHGKLIQCRYQDELYELIDGEIPVDVVSRVIDALYPATVDQIASQPDQVLFDPEDLVRYAEGTLSGFLLKLDEQQEPLVNWALAGPTLVKGGPGSGKSTIALYRIKALVDKALEDGEEVPSVLFVTYTKALTNASTSLLTQLLQDSLGTNKLPKSFRISTFHSTAQWIARRSGNKFNMARESQKEEALRVARLQVQKKDEEAAATLDLFQDMYLLEEFDWVVEGQNCQSIDDYLAAERTGRGIPLTKARREVIWQLYEEYIDHLLAQNLYTWGHLAQFALEQVQSGKFSQRWQYVVVDEAQDLQPVALQLAVELCESPAGVFLTADANQSLYNKGFRWQNVHEGLNVKGRSRILRRNYRSTRQIADAASQILVTLPEADREAMQQQYIHVGPQPMIYAASGSEDQAQWIAEQVYEAARKLRLPLNAAVVLVYSSRVGKPLAEALSEHGLKAKFMSSSQFDIDDPALKVTTLHAAKGLEFPVVVIAHVEDGRLPRETEAREPEAREAHEHGQRRLFYVGCTRAMRRLFLTYDRHAPSPFLNDLEPGRWERA